VFRTATTGAAPGSVCFAVTGITQVSVPLQSILPQGRPGCSLLAAADITALVLPGATGTVRSALSLPRSASLVGGSFFHQTVPFELDGQGALVAVRASNALALTIGTL
jgi:hypothetical protein